MKKVSRIFAFLLAACMLVTVFAGCHGKDEIAYTIGERKFTSAMYSCALFVAASGARNDIMTFVTEQDENADTANIDYAKYKFDADGKVSPDGTVSYNTYVKDRAVTVLTNFVVVLNKFDELGLSLTDEERVSAEADADCQWNIGCTVNTYNYYAAYGVDPSSYFTPYSAVLNKNGVGYNTFKTYMIYEAEYDKYFEYLYGAEGEKAITAEEYNNYLDGHYVIGDVITISKTGSDGADLSEEDLAALKARVDGYMNELEAGKTFAEVYEKYEADEKAASETEEDAENTEETKEETPEETEETEEEKEYTPEAYVNVFGDAETQYESKFFSDMKALKVGEAKLFDDADNKSYIIFVREDILAEEYWLNNFKKTIMWALGEDGYNDLLKEAGKALSVKEDTYATKQFKVKDIAFA